jgi:hypothetical protein
MSEESKLEKRCCDWATRTYGIMNIKTTPFVGYPDRQFMYSGRVLIVEFKAKDQEARSIQQHVHKELMDQGFYVHTIDSYYVFKCIITAWVKRCDQ